jgi:uncharacterized membrane protein
MRRLWIAVALIALIAVSALVGMIVANGPTYLYVLRARH